MGFIIGFAWKLKDELLAYFKSKWTQMRWLNLVGVIWVINLDILALKSWFLANFLILKIYPNNKPNILVKKKTTES